MASNSHDRGTDNHSSDNNNNSSSNRSTHHSIPLQDLSAPPDLTRRSGVGRRIPSLRRGSVRDYERVSGDSPTESNVTLQNTRRARANSQSDDDLPADPGAFAMATVGLQLEPPEITFTPPRRRSDNSEYELGSVQSDGLASPEAVALPHGFLTPSNSNYSDRSPLTGAGNMQPIDGAAIESDSRSSAQTARFPDFDNPGARLGDDLENGFSGRDRGECSARARARSLSPASGSALQRASSMMKSMSQRVVNLSNEPEVVEQSILREEMQQESSRLEEPPALPTLTDYAHDAPHGPSRDSQKPKPMYGKIWRIYNNPLKGKSLGIFGPESRVRMGLCDLLVHPFTEPIILLVIVIQTILLTIESSRPAWDTKRSKHWGENPLDYPYFAIFIIYTLELIAKIIVSGFIINPVEYTTIDRSLGLKKAIIEKGKNLITPQRQFSTKKASVMPDQAQASIIRTLTGGLNQMEQGVPSDDPLQKRRVRLAHRAFLRHSFNRLDFVAVVSYWISFLLAVIGVESARRLYLFRMLSCLRILRLLALTNGTSVILRSLKKAAPLLVHVAFLIGFFWLLFAIVGMQSFKSSFRRTCVWEGQDGQESYRLDDAAGTIQFCGGHLNARGDPEPWIRAEDQKFGSSEPKGYICPIGSRCLEQEKNPFNNTMHFDDILHSLELVFVIMSSNTFTDLLYHTTDSDYLVAALFYAMGFVILSLWMVNLLVAVITHSFQVIREESKRSAFASQKLDDVNTEDLSTRRTSTFKRLYDKTEWFWVFIIIFDLVVQALRSASMTQYTENFINKTEIVVTILLLAEIILRFASDWRKFHTKRRNWTDLGLAVITSIIQIPAIRYSGRPYTVLTMFQILRVYRVVLAFSVTRNLIQVVFRNATGLLNLIVFVFLITFLASIFATQLFRDQIDEQDSNGNDIEITFSNIYNSFVGMYRILSSEGWTTILYSVTGFTEEYKTSWIAATFLILWFIVANFIILNMFIAVIQESFDVSEDEKRLHQVRAFLEQKQVNAPSQGNLSLSRILMMGRDPNRYRDPLDHGPAALEMLLKDAVVREFLDEEGPNGTGRRQSEPLDTASTTAETSQPGILSRMLTRATSAILGREPNPFYSRLQLSRTYDELDPRAMAREVVSAAEQRKQAQRAYLRRHPKYNKSLFIFAPDNVIRRLCQRMVGPGRGNQRAEGVDPYKPVWFALSGFIYLAIVAMVLLACVTTPIYQLEHHQTDKESTKNWSTYSDLGFAVLFSIEALIKVIADGFFWTPNAYFRGSWGFIDGVVLITLWINVASSFSDGWNISRAIGAFKALRALRLLNVSDSAKDTFHSVIIIGGWKVISAASVSLSFLIPFAIYGVNLFNGQMVICNDDNVGDYLNECVGEYMSEPYNWEVLAPRVASNPPYDFDNFGNSLFILFQIVSQEGWTGVQASAMSIRGVGQQPKDNAAPENGLFFIVFNLLGAVFVLTLFVSVFMRNYTEQTGVAYLTAEQRSWLELRKLLRQVSPSKRSFDAKVRQWKMRCYRIAVKKHGRWARCVSIVLLLHLLLLVLEFYPDPEHWDKVRECLFIVFNLFYIANVIIRLLGLGWHRFSRSSWDVFALVVVPGAMVTTVLHIAHQTYVIGELNKLFLVAIALLLIPRNNQLDQLFKTAAASLTSIGNLLATWFVLFLVFGIAMNQAFGLTKFGENETTNINFRDIPRTLILLFRMSCGEGWNDIMEDFATMVPPKCTVDDGNFLREDCGSAAWARPLFIAWNIVSMYIFVSLFVSLIFESFSYVYQRSSGLYAISREDIRRFKQAWATYDPRGEGYISKEQFPRLLGELSGVFDMRIHDGEYTIGRILEECRVDQRDSSPVMLNRVFEGVDLDKLSRILRDLPVKAVRMRRARLNTFYEEVLVSADPDRGISFHSCLMILAHYNVISDSKSLRLEEFLRRRARLQRVEETIRRNTVIGFFDTLYWSREFRRRVDHKKSARMSMPPQFTVPEIFVDDGGEEHGEAPDEGDARRMAQEALVGEGTMLSPSSPEAGPSSPRTSGGAALPRIDTTLAAGLSGRMTASSSPTEWSSISPSLSPRRPRAHTTSSYDPGPGMEEDEQPPLSAALSDQSRPENTASVHDVMVSFGDSAWGESIRRSFTQRRPSERRPNRRRPSEG